jgi:hypothetical protein
MTRTPATMLLVAGLPLVAALALLSPGNAVAGPPDPVPTRMVTDKVAEGLRQYRKEPDAQRRGELLRRLAPTGDPRVAVALGEARMEGPSSLGGEDASLLLYEWFLSDDDDFSEVIRSVRIWWKKNEADLRRRAATLPR